MLPEASTQKGMRKVWRHSGSLLYPPCVLVVVTPRCPHPDSHKYCSSQWQLPSTVIALHSAPGSPVCWYRCWLAARCCLFVILPRVCQFVSRPFRALHIHSQHSTNSWPRLQPASCSAAAVASAPDKYLHTMQILDSFKIRTVTGTR